MRGDDIKIELIKQKKTQKWLLNQLESFVSTDKTELSRTLSGTRRGAKADKIMFYAEQILKGDRICPKQ